MASPAATRTILAMLGLGLGGLLVWRGSQVARTVVDRVEHTRSPFVRKALTTVGVPVAQPAFTSSTLASPLASPLPGSLIMVSPFGWRKDPVKAGSPPEFHQGMDLVAAEGTPVYSPDDAVVAKVYVAGVDRGINNGNGVMLTATSGSGLHFALLHFSQVAVAEGDHVAKGQLVGYSGHTGKASGPHLHVQVWGGEYKPFDPYPLWPAGSIATS